MALFQKPAQTLEEAEALLPLQIPPDVVATMDEDEWYAKCYQGDDAPQLTVRAVLMGSILGFFLAFTNLYIALKTGWHLGVAITACILSFVIWESMRKVGVAKTPMSILENNCMQSTASAAGYSTGGTITSAIAALLILSATPENPGGVHLPGVVLASWVVFLAVLGVCLAIPMKRNMINQEKLKFPSGLAAAVTLQSLYAKGSEASKKAYALLGGSIFGAIFPVLIDLKLITDPATGNKGGIMPADAPIFDWIPGISGMLGSHEVDGEMVPYRLSDWTLVWDMNPVMIAAGMIVGLRISVWMMVGALMLVFVAGPMGLTAEFTNEMGEVVTATTRPWKAWKEIGLWIGAPMMVSSGILSFLFGWRTIVRALSSMFSKTDGPSEHADVEVPMSWFVAGTAASGAGIVALSHFYFEIPWYYGILAVLLTFVLALVAARATGESDITPTGAMGKIMQLTYGVLIPQSATANLMTAGITAGGAGATADLLNDLKSGYLLGANPRRQFVAQAMGIASGTVATVTGFYLLVPDATTLTGIGDKAPEFPAPSAQAWKAVAEVFRDGIGNMHPMHQQAIVVGLIVGAIFVTLEFYSPKKISKFLPSATGLGLGFILPSQYPLSMFVGAVIAYIWTRTKPESASTYIVALASGVVAGVSIVGVVVAMVNLAL